MSQLPIQVDSEIKDALAQGLGVVALESTVITHGLPFPQNLETAIAMENAVRRSGAVPATIAIIDGQIRVGLSADELDLLAKRPKGSVLKCSRRDLPYVLATKGSGSTTVAATMILAQLTGIKVFATGGIGGVHRGHPFDVSADLMELGQTPVTVVCSGAKAILDIPATLEVLETQGVPVIGYQTADFPAFYSRSSGLPVPLQADSGQVIAEIIYNKEALGLTNGILVTVPVPEVDELSSELAESWIKVATQEADAAGITGAAVTPWLLDRLATLSEGKSMTANISLLIHNGQVAGEIAVELANKIKH